MLSRGLLSGQYQTNRVGAGDARAGSPRFQAQNVEHNLHLVAQLRRVADTKGVGVPEIAIAWVLAQDKSIVPVIGARRPDQLHSMIKAQSLTLTPDDISLIAQAVPKGAAAGDRYPPMQMAHLDSERG